MRRTTQQQFGKLVSLMENNPDVARGMGNFGSTRSSRSESWESFASELNALGPPIRNGREWNKVWLDYKLKLKKKVATNRREITATGGGPYAQQSLSALEGCVVELLQLQEAANPTGNTFGTNLPQTTAGGSESQHEESEDETIQQPRSSTTPRSQTPRPRITADDGEEMHEDVQPRSSMAPRSSTSRPRMTAEEREKLRLNELSKQSEVQNTICEGILKIGRNLDDIARYHRKSYDIKKEKLKILKEKEERKKAELIERRKQHKEKIEMKLKELELKNLKYSLKK